MRHVDEPFGCELRAERLMSSRSEPNGLQVERPVALVSSADSLHERRELVVRHPDNNPDHECRGKTLYLYFPERLPASGVAY